MKTVSVVPVLPFDITWVVFFTARMMLCSYSILPGVSAVMYNIL